MIDVIILTITLGCSGDAITHHSEDITIAYVLSLCVYVTCLLRYRFTLYKSFGKLINLMDWFDAFCSYFPESEDLIVKKELQ